MRKTYKDKQHNITSFVGIFVLSILLTMVVDPLVVWANPYSGGNSNCTWYVWQRVNDKLGIQLPGLGNAGTWYESARDAGYSVGTEPKADSIAVWSTSGVGHVAYVESVNGDQIYVSEGGYNLGGYKGYHEGYAPAYGRRYPNSPQYTDTIIGYIYLSQAGDTQAPSISDVQIIDQNYNGYTITCTVTDNVGVTTVRFPTWTEYNGQDDLAADWNGSSNAVVGSLNGSTAIFRVNISDHNNEGGQYHTHIYAYDAAGNYSLYELNDIQVYKDTEKPVISNPRIIDITKDSYTVTADVSDNVGISYVDLMVWSENNGQDDMNCNRAELNGNTFTCTIYAKDHLGDIGNYYTDAYIWDVSGNCLAYRFALAYVGDTEPPVISNPRIIDITKDSYTVTADVTDNVGISYVDLVVWSEKNKDENISCNRATLDGNTFTYTVYTKEHLGNTGRYYTDAYIWDVSGNCYVYYFDEVYIGDTFAPTATATPKPTATSRPIVTAKPMVTVTPTSGTTQKATATPKPPIPTKAVQKVKVPGKPSIKSLTNTKGTKMTIKLSKKVKTAKGYQITYATNKAFTKGKKNIEMTSTSKTIGKLKKGATYYVKVRAYIKTSKGKKVYGSYSGVKKVKIKR